MPRGERSPHVSHIVTITVDGRELPKGVEVLETETICGVKVLVIRATAEQIPELAGDGDGTPLDGWFDPIRTCIFVREGQSETQEADTRVHEKVHAFWYLSGASAVMKLALGKRKSKRWHEIEETLCRTMTPHLVGMGVR